MSITFQCEHCRKEVKAPDEAAGKRGKCPFCGRSNYIPAPVSEEELLPLAPIDEAEERRREAEVQKLLEQERALLSDRKEPPPPPLEQRDDVKSDELYHLVVNYCLDSAQNNAKRAAKQVELLKRCGQKGLQAVDDFISGKAIEPALDSIPTKTLRGMLEELRERILS